MRAEVLHGSGNTAFIAAWVATGTKGRGVDVSVRSVDDAGASVSRAAAALAIGRIWQAGFLLEVERVAAAGLPGSAPRGCSIRFSVDAALVVLPAASCVAPLPAWR